MNLLRLTSICLLFPVLFVAFMAGGCASLSAEERAEATATLDVMGEDSLARLIEQTPGLKAVFDEAEGYMVVDMKVTKVPVVGAGSGKGVVVDKRDGSRSYVKVWRLDLGGGWGIRSYKLIIAFQDAALMKKAESGKWEFEAGAEVAAGAAGLEGGTSDVGTAGFSSYTLSEAGASATVTIRVVRTKPYLE